jgi:hypothetical protein
MQTRLVVAALAILGLQRLAAAQVCERSLALRVNQRGLDFVAEQVRPLIPKQLQIPPVEQLVFDWPMTDNDAVVKVDGLVANLTVQELKLHMEGGALHLQAKADVSTRGPVLVRNAYAGVGDADCQAEIDIKSLDLQVGATLESTTGRTRVTVTEAKINLDNPNSTIALNGCALGTILTPVATFLRSYFMASIQPFIEEIAKEQIPGLVEAKLSDTVRVSGEVQGLTYAVALDGSSTDDQGLGVVLSGSVEAKEPGSAPCLEGANTTPPATCAGVMPALRPEVDAMFGAGVSESLLQQALHAVWRSGLLCIDSRTLALPLVADNLSKLNGTLGAAPGTQIDFQVRLGTAPKVRLSSTGATVDLRGIRLDLTLTPPAGAPGQVTVSADMAVSAEPWINPSTNSVALDLRALEVSKLQILGKQGGFTLDPARLKRFLSEVALPVLQKKVETLQLSPAVMNVGSGFLAELRQVQVADGFLAAYLNAHSTAASAGDRSAPDTSLVASPAPVVGPQVIQIVATGSDDRTPAALLRYRARVDRGEWTEATFSRRIDVTLESGIHEVEVAAVDLNDNMDPTPLLLQFSVDDQAPALELTQQPASLISSDSAEVRFVGSDDKTPAAQLAFQAELYRVTDDGGVPELIAARPYQPGVSSARFDGLEDGLYKIRVIARDEAGNVTSEDAGFTVQREGGCAAGHGPAHASLPGGLLVILFLGAIRRSRLTTARQPLNS